MAEETPKTPAGGVPDYEMAAAFEGPAPLVNKTVLTLTPTTARLSFLEYQPDATRPRHRAAISMNIADLIELQKMLNRTLTEDKIVMQQIMAKAAADAPKR